MMHNHGNREVVNRLQQLTELFKAHDHHGECEIKMDEPGVLMRTQQEYQEETWLQEQLYQLSAQL